MTLPETVNGHHLDLDPAGHHHDVAPLDALPDLPPTAEPEPADDAAAEAKSAGKGKGPSQATILRELALARYRFGCAPDGTPFAVPLGGPRIARALRGGRAGLRVELAKLYARQHFAVPSAGALADALTALEGEAAEHDPEPIGLRVAPVSPGRYALDLGTTDGAAVVIDGGGWHLADASPVLFRRTTLTSALPTPVPAGTGSLDPLRQRLNVSDKDWPLVLGYLVATLIPDIPHPVLALFGEQGTGKSIATKNLVTLFDPSPAPLRTEPKDLEQWAVAAVGSWVIGLDNLSGVKAWLSDAICRAVTGDGMVRRALYTDADVSVMAFQRVIVANGIDLAGDRGDLAERMLAIELETIPDDRRRTADDVTLSEHDHAAVLSALLDLTVRVLAELPHVHLATMPRMANFARILAALDVVEDTAALPRYLGQAATVAEAVIDADPFATALRAFADAHHTWTGPAGDLLTALPVPHPRPREWPVTPRALSARLTRTAPSLRKLGYQLGQSGRAGGTGQRLWNLTAPPRDTGDRGGQEGEQNRDQPEKTVTPSQPSRPPP